MLADPVGYEPLEENLANYFPFLVTDIALSIVKWRCLSLTLPNKKEVSTE
jgi:hypothetical protein